jgi:UPF0176 protein
MTNVMHVDTRSQRKIRSIHITKREHLVHVVGTKDVTQINRYREREKQIQLAKARGVAHLGDDASKIITKKIKQKV